MARTTLLIIAALAAVAALAAANDVGALREIVHGTGGPCDADVDQWSGYFDIDAEYYKHYFYWAFASRGNPATDPVVIWMTGGPGCSSELAALGENGPCTVDAGGASTTSNPYSWNSNANLVYVDQPAGTGFSYSARAGWDDDEAEVAADMVKFIQALLTAHPEWQKLDFYITGESYGGHYVPAVSHAVWMANKAGEGIKVNLKGIGIGNGLTAPSVQYAYYPEMAYNYSIAKIGHPAVSEGAYEQMEAAVPPCLAQIDACQTSTSACGEAQQTCNSAEMGPYEQTGLNPYNINLTCAVPPLCYSFADITTYLNSIRTQLGVPSNITWSTCNFQVNQGFANDWMKDMQQNIPPLLEDGVRVLIYAGDLDFICNWLGNHAWTKALPWSGKAGFNAAPMSPWHVDGVEKGQFQTYKAFTFLRVYDAGHMVPMDQPEAALSLLEHLLKDQPWK
mmetsp:Transcript_13756/g.47975  ORF Transcript_13756/g.47975 Transcript_13756/m.47975 type:complete len:450 (-) Transcript_13756:97-1446(-)